MASERSPHPILKASQLVSLIASLAVVAVLPGIAANFAVKDPYRLASIPLYPMPNEPELVAFLTSKLELEVGKPFRGSTFYWTEGSESEMSRVNLWFNDVASANEYSQLVTPQAFYFIHRVFGAYILGYLNTFYPFFDGDYPKQYWNAIRMFGVRYVLGIKPMHAPYVDGVPSPSLWSRSRLITLPHRPYRPERPSDNTESAWYLHELADPNVGDYSPTQVTVAETGASMTAAMADPEFDFRRQVVLAKAIERPLTPAHDMRLTVRRDGFHVSGRSDGTSLVVLPYQFSNCLRPRDSRARVVRANLMMAGIMFSGDLDTDVVFDYGLFSPACRLADLADTKKLDLKIDLKMPHLLGDRWFARWPDARARLDAAAKAFKLDNPYFFLPVLGPVDLSLKSHG